MAQVLEYALRLNDAAFAGPVARSQRSLGGLNNALGGMGRQTAGVNSLAASFTGLAAKIGAAFTAYKALEAGFSGLGKSIKIAADAETTATSFKVLLGNADQARIVLEQIKKLGAETPFEFPELATAGKMLLAFGESAADIPDTLRRIGDIASGVAAPIGDIAEIYGKARTAGTLFAEDINQLTGRGIPIIREFARVLKVPESAVKKLAEEGKITFPTLETAFKNLTSKGGQFFGMMAEQSATTNGLLSTLQDAVGALYLEFGKPINDAIKPLLQDAIGLAEQLAPLAQSFGTRVGEALGAMRDFVAKSEEGGGVVEALGSKLKAVFSEAGEYLLMPFQAIGAALPSLGKAFMQVMTPVMDWLEFKFEELAYTLAEALSEQLADIFGEIPFMQGISDAFSANAHKGFGNAAWNRNGAEKVAESMPDFMAGAAELVSEAVTAAKNDFQKRISDKSEIDRFKAEPPVSLGEIPGFKSGGMARQFDHFIKENGDRRIVPFAAASTAAAKKTEAAAAKRSSGGGGGGGGGLAGEVLGSTPAAQAADGGRKKIKGYSQAQGPVKRMGEENWWSLQRGPSAWSSLQAGFDQRNFGLAGRRPTPKLTTPGASKSQQRKEAAAQQAAAASGGGELAVITALVKEIAANTAKLKVVT